MLGSPLFPQLLTQQQQAPEISVNGLGKKGGGEGERLRPSVANLGSLGLELTQLTWQGKEASGLMQ